MVHINGTALLNGQPAEEGLAAIQVNDPNKTIVIRTVPIGSVPSKVWEFEIISLYPCDESGKPKYSFLLGKRAYFNITIKNNTPLTKHVLITINVYDNSSIPIGMMAAGLDIVGGHTASWLPSIYIEKWASNGSAVVYVNVYTDWPKDGGHPVCPEKMATFYLLKSKYEESGLPSSSETPSNKNGTFKLNFRLSPEVPPGEYTVNVIACSGGLFSWASIEFNVESKAAPPWPDFVIVPPVASPGYEITFDASYSSAEGYGDSIISYYWDFGDGTNATGIKVTHAYSDLGNYTITLNVTDSEGLWNITSRKITIAIIHDIAILKIECLDQVYNNWLAPVKITVKNKGTFNESFNLTLRLNSSIIGVMRIANLDPFEIREVAYEWNTTGLSVDSYCTIEATVDILENESDSTDNSLSYGPIWIKLLGDVDGNRIINIYDIVALTSIYGLKEGNAGWNVVKDLIRDGKINIYDIVCITIRYGTRY